MKAPDAAVCDIEPASNVIPGPGDGLKMATVFATALTDSAKAFAGAVRTDSMPRMPKSFFHGASCFDSGVIFL